MAAPDGWLGAVLTGALAPGVNRPTHTLLHVLLGLVVASLLALLAVCCAAAKYAALVPHVLVLLGLAAGLWALCAVCIAPDAAAQPAAEQPAPEQPAPEQPAADVKKEA